MSPDLRRIDQFLRYHAETAPEAEAWAADGRRWSYRDADLFVDQIAGALLAHGVSRHDRVAVHGKPSPEVIAFFLALGRIGAVYVGLNPRYTADELSYILGHCEPVAIVALLGADKFDRPMLSALTLEMPSIRIRIGLECDGAIALDAFLNCASPDAHAISVAGSLIGGDDPALIVYTSGSTGRPKGAVLQHHGLTFVGAVFNDPANFGVGPGMRMLCMLPINHVGCMVDICSNTIWAGGTIVFHEDFDPRRILEDLSREQITLLGGVPTMFLMMTELREFAAADFSAVRRVIVAGNAAPVELVRALRKATGAPVQTGYGLTECFGFSSFSAVDDPAEITATTIGRFDRRIDWRIADAEGQHCTPGAVGEIQMRGDCVFLGYFRDPEATRAAFTQDGWFRTGDLGALEADGTVRLAGRSSEMFKSGGYNVYPLEVEQALERVPGVSMAIVVPVADPLYSEVGHAFVVTDQQALTPEAILEAVRSYLANFKVPKRVDVIAELPLLPIGKVDRRALRQRAAEAKR